MNAQYGFKSPSTLIKRLEENAEKLHGKKGVTEARALAQRIRSAAQQHDTQMHRCRNHRNIYGDAPARAREWIATWAACPWRRGEHQELEVIGFIPYDRWLRHPDLKDFSENLKLIDKAKKLFPEASYSFDYKGRGSAVSLDLYGVGFGLLLMQLRVSERRTANGFLSVRKRYFLTDGKEKIEVPPERIKRAAAKDPSPESTILALLPILPKEWADRINPEPIASADG